MKKDISDVMKIESDVSTPSIGGMIQNVLDRGIPKSRTCMGLIWNNDLGYLIIFSFTSECYRRLYAVSVSSYLP